MSNVPFVVSTHFNMVAKPSKTSGTTAKTSDYDTVSKSIFDKNIEQAMALEQCNNQ